MNGLIAAYLLLAPLVVVAAGAAMRATYVDPAPDPLDDAAEVVAREAGRLAHPSRPRTCPVCGERCTLVWCSDACWRADEEGRS